MRLIDAEALIKNIQNRFIIPRWCLIVVKEEIDKQPTIDAEPVVHGRWFWDDGLRDYKCSCCGKMGRFFKYCPTCGAKMDLEGE